MQNISVVAAELGVGSLERRVTGSLGLLDSVTRDKNSSAKLFHLYSHALSPSSLKHCRMIAGLRCVVERGGGGREVGGFFETYPFL